MRTNVLGGYEQGMQENNDKSRVAITRRGTLSAMPHVRIRVHKPGSRACPAGTARCRAPPVSERVRLDAIQPEEHSDATRSKGVKREADVDPSLNHSKRGATRSEGRRASVPPGCCRSRNASDKVRESRNEVRIGTNTRDLLHTQRSTQLSSHPRTLPHPPACCSPALQYFTSAPPQAGPGQGALRLCRVPWHARCRIHRTDHPRAHQHLGRRRGKHLQPRCFLHDLSANLPPGLHSRCVTAKTVSEEHLEGHVASKHDVYLDNVLVGCVGVGPHSVDLRHVQARTVSSAWSRTPTLDLAWILLFRIGYDLAWTLLFRIGYDLTDSAVVIPAHVDETINESRRRRRACFGNEARVCSRTLI